MVIALGFCTFFLAVLCLFFALRARILRLSVREIREQAREKSATDSGTPVCPQSGDKDIRALAEYLTDELDRLIAARRTYAAGNSELKEAVTGVSHDLRTPLTSVSGYLDLLAKSGLSERQAEYVRIIGGRVEAMKKLTEELLAYSVVATDEGSLQSEEVCINSLLEDCLMQFYVAFPSAASVPKCACPRDASCGARERTLFRACSETSSQTPRAIRTAICLSPWTRTATFSLKIPRPNWTR